MGELTLQLTCGGIRKAKAEEAEAARKKAEALAEAARAEKAGVLCGVWGVL